MDLEINHNYNLIFWRTQSDSQFENTEMEELLSMLRETESLEEQGDIIHYLVFSHGLDFVTGAISY